jgi:integrase
MATEFKMSWRDEQGGRWRKRYRGRDYYFPRLPNETKATSYRRCWDAWLAKKAEIDRETDWYLPHRRAYEANLSKVRSMLTKLEAVDSIENRKLWEWWYAQLCTYQYLIQERIPYPFPSEGAKTQDPSTLPLELGGGQNLEMEGVDDPAPWEKVTLPELDVSKTVRGLVDRFTEKVKHDFELGRGSIGRYTKLTYALEPFVKFSGSNLAIAGITAQLLSDYKDSLDREVRDGKLSPHTAKDRLTGVKQMIRWAYELELLELPRNLASRSLNIAVPESVVEIYTDGEIQALLKGASENTRMYLLLMLNTGMLQGDLASLAPSEVDWKRGRIIRKRSKTRKHENVPEVSYLLWPETFALLKKLGHRKGKHALLNANGEPLKVERIVDGKSVKLDNVHSAFRRLSMKLKNKKPLKLIRKTSASKLASHSEYGRYAQYFLGHAPTSVADRHYIRPSEAQFDEALRWLRSAWL